MDSNNPPRQGPKFDPMTGQPIADSDAETTAPQPPVTPSQADLGTPPTPQEFRVATTNGDNSPTYTPPAPTTPYSYPPSSQEPQPQPPYGPPPQQVNVTQPKRSSATPLIIGALALLLIAGGVAAFFLMNRAGIVGGNNAAIERALPANTLGYFHIDPSPSDSQKRAFDKMREAFEAQPGFKEAVEKMGRDMQESASSSECFPAAEGQGLDFINSYLGDNLTIAVLPPSTDDLNTIKAATEDGAPGEIEPVAKRNIVGLVDLDFNPVNKKGPLAEIKNIADKKTALVETYNETDIRKYSCAGTDLYFGLLSGTNTAVVGADVSPIKRIIDEYKLNKGLKEDATYKYLSGAVPADRVATFYVNLTEIMRYAEVMAPEAFSSGTMPKMQGGMIVTISGQEDGLQIDTASEAKYENLGFNMNFSGSKPDPSMLNDVPSESMAFLVSTDLKSTLTAVLDSAKKQDTTGVIGDVEAQVKKETGLDLRNDILSWMGGDFAVSGSMSGMVFQLKLNGDDRAKAESSVRTVVDKTLKGQATEFQAAGGTFFDLGPGVGAIGVTGDRLVYVNAFMGGNSKAAVEAFNSKLGQGMGTTDKWKDISRHLPANSQGAMYVDVSSLMGLAGMAMSGGGDDTYEKQVAPFVRPIKYVLIGGINDPFKENEPMRGIARIFIGISK